MSTISIAKLSRLEDEICQGDIFKNVKYNYIDSENSTDVNIVEYNFPLSIIVSQACDVIGMEDIVKNSKGKPNKFMPSILMCPIYDSNDIKKGGHIKGVYDELSYVFDPDNLYMKSDREVAKNDWHYRYHNLNVRVNDKDVLENTVIDFKHYFTVPMSYLVQNKTDRMLHLDDIYAEQITLQFSVFLTRVAIPDKPMETSF